MTYLAKIFHGGAFVAEMEVEGSPPILADIARAASKRYGIHADELVIVMKEKSPNL